MCAYNFKGPPIRVFQVLNKDDIKPLQIKSLKDQIKSLKNLILNNHYMA